MFLIEDGYNLQATVPASAPYEAITFRFRPADAEQASAHLEKSNRPGKSVDAAVELLEHHVISWTVTDRKKASVPCKGPALRKLPLPRLNLMADFVTGYAQGAQEYDEKNSLTGSESGSSSQS